MVLLYKSASIVMKIAAFDSKGFHRGKYIVTVAGANPVEKYLGFNSQLGMGVIMPDSDEFVKAFVGKVAELRESFKIKDNLPFFSSSHLIRILGMKKAILFADQVITHVQNLIETVHCSYVILPPKKISHVKVGGFNNKLILMPTNKFLDNLGSMFSYLTASSYLHRNTFIENTMEFHIDAFRSKSTPAWTNFTEKISPKIFWSGNECNPFIACADLLAFLTDVKLYTNRLKLEPADIKQIWSGYSFDVTVHFYNENNLTIYSWYDDMNIDIIPYMAKPTLFLAIDNIEDPRYADKDYESSEISEIKPRKFHNVIKKSDVYYSAVRHMFGKCGSLKIFQRPEDKNSIQDGDIFVYVGQDSKKIGEDYRRTYDIKLMSGLELRRETNKKYEIILN